MPIVISKQGRGFVTSILVSDWTKGKTDSIWRPLATLKAQNHQTDTVQNQTPTDQINEIILDDKMNDWNLKEGLQAKWLNYKVKTVNRVT